jgi:hypothetical protein
MARPRVFVSSTYYDLKHIRATLEAFIESFGFDAVLFEKGDIAFLSEVPLDESCYREAETADIFVLIVGGRYGSRASTENSPPDKDLVGHYESITKKEFESAQSASVPTFILVDSAVAAEYRTYQRNRDNETISYAHVDTVGVFRLLDSIFGKSKNNPVFNFEKTDQIEAWLREQWAGLFRELLRTRSQQKQLSTLNTQISELRSVNDTLKKYLEEVLSKIIPDENESKTLIEGQEKKLLDAKIDFELEMNEYYNYLTSELTIPANDAKEFISTLRSTSELKSRIDQMTLDSIERRRLLLTMLKNEQAQKDFNGARKILGLPPILFD